MRSASIAVGVVLAIAALTTSCSDGDDERASDTTATSVASSGSEVETTDAPRPGAVPEVAGDGDGPSIEDQLAAATIPPSPEDCRSADVDAVSEVIGTDVAFTIGLLDPSGRALCRFVDTAETTLVRVLVTAADGDPTAAESFAELAADPTAVPIDATSVRVGRVAARLDGTLVEVTVEPDAVADDAAAGDAAVALLTVVG